MDSFSRIAREMRDQRQALTRTSSPAGRGYRFCSRHRVRYAEASPCPGCFPPVATVRQTRRR